MEIIYTGEKAPESFSKSIFLAGPTPRSKEVASWRPEALKILEKLNYDGIVFLPEYRDPKHQCISENLSQAYIDQIEWEEKHLHMADCILFWIPRNLDTMPAFTTNTEWGVWQDSGKAIFGAPADAEKIRYQQYYAKKLFVPDSDTLEGTIKLALELIGEGALRSDGEKEVPLFIWNTPAFQQWYALQKYAGNRLDGAKVKWSFRIHKNTFAVFWALHVNVYIASENRNKINEVIVGRPDISTLLIYRKNENIDDSDIVLVREFRSPVCNHTGFVWELPGGSSAKSKDAPDQLAAHECLEETGLEIGDCRMRRHKIRQIAPTLSTHRAHLFSVQVTVEELDFLRSQHGLAHGLIGDSERTYVEVMKLKEIRRQECVDWSTLGMILSVLTE